MKASELITRLQSLIAEHLEQGYEPEEALNAARQAVMYDALSEATGKDVLDAHEYWNTDDDYFVDFWRTPRPIIMQRLTEAAAEIKEALGIAVHLCPRD